MTIKTVSRHFTRLCAWTVIGVDKCSNFRIRKRSTSSTQYLPKQTINHEISPTVDNGNLHLSIDISIILWITNPPLLSSQSPRQFNEKIYDLFCHRKNELRIYLQCVLSNFFCFLTIDDRSCIWVMRYLDNTIAKYAGQWVEPPNISSTLSSVTLQNSKYEVNFSLPSAKFIE